MFYHPSSPYLSLLTFRNTPISSFLVLSSSLPLFTSPHCAVRLFQFLYCFASRRTAALHYFCTVRAGPASLSIAVSVYTTSMASILLYSCFGPRDHVPLFQAKITGAFRLSTFWAATTDHTLAQLLYFFLCLSIYRVILFSFHPAHLLPRLSLRTVAMVDLALYSLICLAASAAFGLYTFRQGNRYAIHTHLYISRAARLTGRSRHTPVHNSQALTRRHLQRASNYITAQLKFGALLCHLHHSFQDFVLNFTGTSFLTTMISRLHIHHWMSCSLQMDSSAFAKDVCLSQEVA